MGWHGYALNHRRYNWKGIISLSNPGEQYFHEELSSDQPNLPATPASPMSPVAPVADTRFRAGIDEYHHSEGSFTCDLCGACCKTFAIFVAFNDATREPRIALEGRRLPAWQGTATWEFQLFPLPFHESCCFLDNNKQCVIYPTRPDVCRSFAAGGEQCQEARQRQSLPPLQPDP